VRGERQVRRKLVGAVAREVVAFAAVHFVPPLRRYKRWYWIANGVAVLAGVLIGAYAVLRDRFGP
jgi:hypothetical protein